MPSGHSDPADGFPASVFDLAELGSLFAAHGPRLVAIVRRRLDSALGGRLDAEDVVGAAFLDARRKWPAYQADRSPEPFVWLYRIALDRLVEEWRRHFRAKQDARREVPWPDHPSIDLGLRASQTGASRAAVRAEEAALLRRALDSLREADREVILLRAYDDLSFREIGGLLGAGENAVTVRYVRALKRLRAAWQALTGESRP